MIKLVLVKEGIPKRRLKSDHHPSHNCNEAVLPARRNLLASSVIARLGSSSFQAQIRKTPILKASSIALLPLRNESPLTRKRAGCYVGAHPHRLGGAACKLPVAHHPDP